MRLFYVDDSGNTGTALDAAQPIHWLVGIGFSPQALAAIEKRLLSLALQHFPQRARQPDFEFHGYELFSGRGDCRGMKPEERVALYGEVLACLKAHDCPLFVRGIDKAAHQKRAGENGYIPEHPYTLAARYLLERIDEWLESQGTTQEPVYGLLVADEQHEVARDMVALFALWRDQGTQLGYRSRDIRFLLDTIHFVPSHDSWLIQLADCAAFLRNRYERVKREKGSDSALYSQSEAAIVRLWEEHCQPCVINDRVWP